MNPCGAARSSGTKTWTIFLGSTGQHPDQRSLLMKGMQTDYIRDTSGVQDHNTRQSQVDADLRQDSTTCKTHTRKFTPILLPAGPIVTRPHHIVRNIHREGTNPGTFTLRIPSRLIKPALQDRAHNPEQSYKSATSGNIHQSGQHKIIRSICVQVSSKTSTDLRLAQVICVHITQPLQPK